MSRRAIALTALVLLPASPIAAQQMRPASHAITARSLAPADACDSSYRRGGIVARANHSAAPWRVGGFVSGVAFSVFGVAGATMVANTTVSSPDSVPPREDSACYRDGYRTVARKRQRGSAFRSALLGAVILPTAWFIRLRAH